MRGREGLEREARKLGMDPVISLKNDYLLKLARSFNFNGIEDLYATLGDGAITFKRALMRLKDEVLKNDPALEDEQPVLPLNESKMVSTTSQGVRVKGVDNVLIRFSRCCTPLPGDDIIGFITRGRGVSVHRRDCPELFSLSQEDQNRLIEVEWEDGMTTVYPVDIGVIGQDRARLVSDIMNVFMDTRTHVLTINAKVGKDRVARIQLKIEARNIEHLEFVLNKIRRVKDVTVVERI